jgi:hypothetical protein
MSDISALNAFPPEWWLGRREIDPGNGHPDGGHYPYARPLRLHWSQLADGTWTSESQDPHQWEVFCLQCGDRDGPIEIQDEDARLLRGPDASKHQAVHAAKRDFEVMVD